jgi:hypothetical protein
MRSDRTGDGEPRTCFAAARSRSPNYGSDTEAIRVSAKGCPDADLRRDRPRALAVAGKHLGMLGAMPHDPRRLLENALRSRHACSLDLLVKLPEANREALATLRLGPRTVRRSPETQRAPTHPFLPPSVLEQRREPRSSP